MDERRNYKRVTVQKHVGNHDCILELDGAYYYAKLIDISASGARFYTEKALNDDMYGKYGYVAENYYTDKSIYEKNYSVAWNSANEVGVRFDNALSAEYSYLESYYSATN